MDIAPAPIWLEDWSEVEAFCLDMKAKGVTDLRAALEADTEMLRSVVSRIRIVDVNTRAAEFVGAPDAAALIGHLPGELLNEGTLDSLIDQIMVIWNGEATLQVDISGVDMGGADIECQLDWAAPTRNDIPDYSEVIVLIRDVSHHRSAERAMEKHVAQLETLLDMGRGIASTFDVAIILEILAAVSAELMEGDQCLIVLLDQDAERITQRVTHGTFAEELPPSSYSEVMSRIPGWVVRNRTATTSVDMTEDPRSGSFAAETRALFARRPAAVAPILVDDLVLGTLTVMKSPGTAPFTDRDLSLVRMLAMQAAVAIRNAEIYEELRESRDTVQAAHEELKDAQTQLLSAQKMEAIGSLASGIAHEINTPIQFVSDNTSFVKDSLAGLFEVAAARREFIATLTDEPKYAEELEKLDALWAQHDCDFLMEELPDAVDETLEGAKRVAEIVRAMKEFAHPGSQDKSSVDINRVVETTMQVSRNEWKYVAELELDLDPELPLVQGLAGPLGQILLVMFVNSAQAMAEVRNLDEDGKGTIRVSTRADGDVVELRVADNGPGIPKSIVDQVFDPFFTTKEVGTGSGQGLSIARSVVVDKHQGEIWIEDANPGAVFVIRLPIDPPRSSGTDSEDE
jgi:signal transduction histidine kinase